MSMTILLKNGQTDFQHLKAVLKVMLVTTFDVINKHENIDTLKSTKNDAKIMQEFYLKKMVKIGEFEC